MLFRSRENVTNVSIKGAEAGVEYQVNNRLKLIGSYTFNESRIDAFAKKPDLENKFLKYVPQHAASASIFWKSELVNTTIRGIYKGKQFGNDANTVALDPYFTLDIQLSRQFWDHYTVSLDVKDVFDNRHMETMHYLSPGRTITARAALRF